MARKMGRNLKRAAAGLMACAAVSLCAISPAWGEERAGDVVNVTVPTRIDCALGADGTVTSPGGLEVVNNGPQDLYVAASTVDDFGQKVEFAIDLGGSPLLSRAGGKDVEGEVEFAGSSRKGLGLAVSKLNRTSHAALMDAAAQGEAPMFTVGFKFTFKALQGSMSISGDAKLGKTLSAVVTGAQADAKLAYRWYRDGQLIAGAETASYTTNDADLGKKLKCEAYDADGRYVGAVSAEVGPIKGIEAFAVFSADDGSLNFYKRADMPKAGERFEGKTVTEVYTGFERDKFNITNSPHPDWRDVETNAPWFPRRLEIISASVIDKGITVDSLQFWFTRLSNIKQIDLILLDASNAETARGAFGLCENLVGCKLPNNLQKLNDLIDMFYLCGSLQEIDLSCIGTSIEPRNLFGFLQGCRSLTTVKIPRQNVSSLTYTFGACFSITDFSFVEDWDVSSVKGDLGFHQTFAHCGALKNLNLSKWKPQNDADISGMFMGCKALSSLDISSFESANIIKSSKVFLDCDSLSEIKIGRKFTWLAPDGYLPTPNPNTIPGADGKWYAMSNKKGYAPADIPSNKADTYVASPEMLPKETFAVFSEDDGSLNFYHRNIVPTMGSQFEGKVATEIYTDFINKPFQARPGHIGGAEMDSDAIVDTPWFNKHGSIVSVNVIDNGIAPKQMVSWFQGLNKCQTFNLDKIDTSHTQNVFRLFMNCASAKVISLNGWDTSQLRSTSGMFYNCAKLDTINLNGLSFENVISMQAMFLGCSSLKTIYLNNSKSQTSLLNDIGDLFFGCSSLEMLDMTSFDTLAVTKMYSLFTGCNKLREIKVGKRFSINDHSGYLPAQSNDNIPGADGYWYDAATGEPYKPEEIPSNKAATYVAVNPVKAPTVTISGEAIYGSTLTARVSGQPADTTTTSYQWQYYNNGDWRNTGLPGGNTATLTLTSNSAGTSCEGFKYRCVVTTTAGKKRVPQGISQAVGPVDAAPTGEAFAVYSAYDRSLNFYKRTNVPTNGDWYDGRTATEVYRDIETTRYYDRRQPDWLRYNHSITKVRFFEPIRPISTSYWFYGFTVANIDLSKLYTSSVTDMSYMFYNCSYAPNLGVSHFNTSNVTNMNRMFYNCSSVSKLDLSNFDTSNVTNMNYMFGGCSSLTTIDMSGFDTSNVSNMDWMYSGCSKLKQVTLGAKFAWKSTYGYLPTPSGGQWYAASDGRGYAPEDIPSNKADTYYASKSLLPVTADEAPEAAMPDVEPGGDAAGTGADPEVEADAIGSEAVVPGEAENEEAERKPDEDVGAGSDGDEKLDESSSETASAAGTPPEEEEPVPVTSDEAQ